MGEQSVSAFLTLSGAARRQVGVDKVRLKGRLRVTLPLFDELPCIAGIQVAFGVR